MRLSFKRLLCYFVSIAIFFDFYIFLQFYNQQINDFDDDNNNNQEKIYKNFKQDSNEFLVLDWTGNEHIFKEPDPIPCDFSHITPFYCQTKFNSIENQTLRLNLINQCSHLSTIIIRWTANRSYLNKADLIAYHSIHMPINNLPKLKSYQFSTVYILESEVHSLNGEYWHKIDFPIWYNLKRSYPEPITYFDLQIYLQYLFSPIRIPFSEKIQTVSIVWISSNCRAYNGRHLFLKKLMSYISIDSYGKCLNNKKFDKIQTNSLLYSSYKFVIAIENSNCEDYVTEKLIEVFSSTSIPIIASRNNKPDYKRFAPNYSYINIYDYKTIEELVNYLNYLSNNETAYNEYLWFRKKKFLNNKKLSLNEYLNLSNEIFGINSTIRQWLLTKETSRNKYCKLTEFIYTNDWKNVSKKKKFNRPTINEVCLPRNDLISFFF